MTPVDPTTSRRAFLAMAAAGVAGAVSACGGAVRSITPVAASARPWRARVTTVSENSRPGTDGWVIHHLGAHDEIMGYAGSASVAQGERFPLYVSTTADQFQVNAYRIGWYQGHGARQVWRSQKVKGAAQGAARVSSGTKTVSTDWDPVLEVPTDDWPPGAYLLKLSAASGGQRYVPVTVRSPSCAGKIVLKSCVQTWQAYNMWGGHDLYHDASNDYGNRSLVVSLDRPYDLNGADMFLTYERNAIKLAEYLGLDLAYVTSMDIDADPRLLTGASALVSMGHDEYWTPAERANVTAARNSGVNLAFLGANAMFRRTRLQSSPLGAARQVVCYKSDYPQDPMYGVHSALVTSDWRDGPDPNPESSLIGTSYEGYPVNAAFVVASPRSWVFKGTGVSSGDAFPNLVGVEYDRVDPGYPLQRPIEVLSHSPLTCNGAASYGDSAYYTHPGGAGVFNCGTMRWVEALYGDQPHGIGGGTPDFVRAVTTNVLRAFADGPAAAKYPAHDNLAAIDEHIGSPIGSPANLQ
jgi:N,N-dimethylformamidase beta subunit-like protein